jgi:hypothetical protein
MHLPQLVSPDVTPGSGAPAFMSSGTLAITMNPLEMVCSSQYMAKLMMALADGNTGEVLLNNGVHFVLAADWSILDMLLASRQNLD